MEFVFMVRGGENKGGNVGRVAEAREGEGSDGGGEVKGDALHGRRG